MKRLHLSVAVVGLVGLSGAAWWWQHRAAAPSAPRTEATVPNGAQAAAPTAAGGPAAVEVAQALRQSLTDDTTAVGSLTARQGVVVRPEVSGRIVQLGFQDGERVRRGQLLVQMDDSLPRAQLQQAQAQASIARTTLARNKELVAQNFVTQSVVDQAQSNLEVAQAQVALAQAQLEKLRILAPFDGVAGIRKVNVGDYLKDGADIVALQDVSSLYVDFRLPERFTARVKPGQSVAMQFDALPGQDFEARVDALESVIDADGRSLAVRARLAQPAAALKPGMFARVRVVLAERSGAVMVPEEALVPQGGKQFVVKVVEGAQGPVSQRLEVATGLRRAGKVEILNGVAHGDTVVTAGQARLMRGDGVPLRVVQVGSAVPAASAASAPKARQPV
ncbi:efflux RND transporter periplasmic adaptor subunit [Caldimonas sp. KR1-144]|uniref:efflux RND transporter periplasmic adaptor subunit n=1 Tax=Caldimonas sp. KR1-144 TaxID=3400911 RepID=UPI003BFC7640